MRRSAAVLSIACLLTSLAMATPAPSQSQDSIRVVVDGEPVVFDVAPVETQGRVLVPLRGIFERLDARVDYDAYARTIVVVRGPTTIRLGLGRRDVSINGRTSTLDVPAASVRGRTLVPLRFVSEALGASVQWDAAARIVSISTGASAGARTPARSPRSVPGGQTISGVLLSVNPTSSRITIQQPSGPVTVTLTADTTILRANADSGQGGSARLSELRPGDHVQAVVDENVRAVSVRASYRAHSGRIDAVTAQALILDDGSAYRVSTNAEVSLDGKPATLGDLRRGMLVTVRTPPQQNDAWGIDARSATTPSPAPTSAASAAPAGAGGATADARVTSIQVTPNEPLRAGQSLTVTLRGTPGGRGVFSVGDVVKDVPMREQQPGVYVGTYTVRPGDNAAGAFALARIVIGAASSPVLQSSAPITLDTTAPRIVELVPAAGSRVAVGSRTNVVVVADDGGGSGIASIRLVVRGQDVTAAAQRSDKVLTYTLPRAFAEGAVSAQAVVTDRAGNAASQTWLFEVTAARSDTGVQNPVATAPGPQDAPIPVPPGRPSAPVVTEPTAGAQLSSPTTVRGRAQPGTRVRVTIVELTPVGPVFVSRQIAEADTVTNRSGTWSVVVSLRDATAAPRRGQITAVAHGASNEASEPAVVEVRLRGSNP